MFAYPCVFQGFGIINRAELVTQFDLKSEKELFDRNWISLRRDMNLDSEQSLEYALLMKYTIHNPIE